MKRHTAPVLLMAGSFLCLGIASCDGELPMTPDSDAVDSPQRPSDLDESAAKVSRAFAGRWTAKVTGGGMAYTSTCNVVFQNVSATGRNGAARGQVQITTYRGSGAYPDCVADEIWFQYHAVVTDLEIRTAPDGAKVANVCYDVTKVQYEPPMQLNTRFGIAIKEGGRGSGDMTRRARDITCVPDEFYGDDEGEDFRTVVVDGNYTLRER
ncbi:MAG: hypothetical protein KJP18_17510 [Gemmatimonadetes bacterium]|nr:hypothetical protein [Gemmatimonadota bacterium]